MADGPSPKSPFAAYDALAALARSPGAAQAEIVRLAAEVSSDLKRRGRWPGVPETVPPAEKAERAAMPRLVPVLLVVWLGIMLAAALVAGWLMVLPFLAVCIPVIALEVHRRRSERARRERAARPTCPACAYDLSGLADDLPREWVVGSSGPSRCPECGRAWPLVGRDGWDPAGAGP